MTMMGLRELDYGVGGGEIQIDFPKFQAKMDWNL